MDVATHGYGYQALRKLNGRDRSALKERRRLAGEIHRKSNIDCTPYEVWLDLPPDPPKGDPGRTYVKKASGDLVTMDRIFPMDEWAGSYTAQKWRGHVFCPPEHQRAVYEAAVDVLGQAYDIEFNGLSRALSHVPQ